MALRKRKKRAGGNPRKNLITVLDRKSPISEQYRTVRTNIQYSSVDKEKMSTIMITSSGPGEGKSTTAANLAVVFAQQGKKVLLVDADMRRPTVHYTFDVTNTTGFTSVLTRQVPLMEAIKKTEEDGLYVLTSGPIPPNPAELLSSRAMFQLVEEAKSIFDVILFDTPPLLAVADPQILANLCDGSILVVFSGKTDREQALKAKELLKNAKSKLLGVVLNHKEAAHSHYYYYYGTK